jgi:hypothetical protein
MSRGCFSRGEREADEQRGDHAEQQCEQDLVRHEGDRRHRGVIREPASRHLVERRGERQRADHRPYQHRLAPAHAALARVSHEGDDSDDRDAHGTQNREPREEIVPRSHLGIPPPE